MTLEANKFSKYTNLFIKASRAMYSTPKNWASIVKNATIKLSISVKLSKQNKKWTSIKLLISVHLPKSTTTNELVCKLFNKAKKVINIKIINDIIEEKKIPTDPSHFLKRTINKLFKINITTEKGVHKIALIFKKVNKTLKIYKTAQVIVTYNNLKIYNILQLIIINFII